MKLLSMTGLAALIACIANTAFCSSLDVGFGTSQQLTTSASYDAATVNGVLDVSNGAVIDGIFLGTDPETVRIFIRFAPLTLGTDPVRWRFCRCFRY